MATKVNASFIASQGVSDQTMVAFRTLLDQPPTQLPKSSSATMDRSRFSSHRRREMNERGSSSGFKKRSTSLLVLGLLHHGITTTGAFPVVATSTGTGMRRATLPAPSHFLAKYPPGVATEHLTRRYALRNSPQAEANTVESAANAHDHKKGGWRRRVLSRLRRKRGSLEASPMVDETPRTAAATVDQFILENFERLSPEQLFSTLEKSHYVLDTTEKHATQASFFSEAPLELPVMNVTDYTTFQEEEEDQRLLDCALPISLIGRDSSFEGGPPLRKVVRNWFQNLLTNCFHEWAAEKPQNLQVRCSPTGNVLPSLLRGQLNCNARAEFDRIVFDFLSLSGGTIEGSRLALNLLAFTVDHSKEFQGNDKKTNNDTPAATQTIDKPTRSRTVRLLEAKKLLPRYQTVFDLHAHDCILTQADLFESSCVRNGLQRLSRRILKRRGIQTKSVTVTDISVLPNGKVAIQGEASVKGVIPTRIVFEVRSGIEMKHRGHVVAFPGLELSLSPDVGLFVPIPNVELDIGHNARLREIVIDGEKKHLKLSASVTITPQHTLKLSEAYSQSSRAFSAPFSYDVGKWLTRIGRFSL